MLPESLGENVTRWLHLAKIDVKPSTLRNELDCCQSRGQIPASCCGAFERLGTDAAQMAVTAGPVGEHLDVIENVGSGQIPGSVDAFADTFLFKTAEEGLRCGIVPAIASPAHAWLEVMGLTKSTEVVTAKLTTLVGMHDDPFVRLPAPYGHEQRVLGQFS